MKHHIVNILLLLILFISSCGKEKYDFKFLANANVNGTSWQGKAFTSDLTGTDRIAFDFTVANNKDVLRETMGALFIPKEVGVYDFDFISTDSLFRSLYATMEGNDVVKDVYNLDENKLSNFISIDRLSETEIEGTFDLTFAFDTTWTKIDPNAPDTIHFTNGKFLSEI